MTSEYRNGVLFWSMPFYIADTCVRLLVVCSLLVPSGAADWLLLIHNPSVIFLDGLDLLESDWHVIAKSSVFCGHALRTPD